MPTRSPREDTHADREARTRWLAQMKAIDAPCYLCPRPIDWDAPPGHPDAPTRDHIKPVHTHPELQHDPANWALAHHSCNASKGKRKLRADDCPILEWWK